MCEFDSHIVFHLVGDHAQPEAMLKLADTPRFARRDLMMVQPQHEQVGQQGNPKRFFMLLQVATYLMLTQAQVRFQVPIDEFDTPSELVQPHHLSCRYLWQIGHQEFRVARADVTPGFAQHQGDLSNVAQTKGFGIDPIGLTAAPVRQTRYPGPTIIVAR